MNATPADNIGIGSILRETYELVSVLGKGGMGKVYLARHLRLPGKQVAVKVLHTQEEITPDQYARFRREAEITSRLGHPNIVGVLDFYGQEDGAPCLVMEHLKGESLSQRIRRGRIPFPEVMFIARQIGSALHAAHQVGVIHRDLKPGNIFLVPTESGGVVTQQVKLLDFGISKIVTSQTLQTVDDVLMGTPQYMSPEQAMGQNSTVDARSDLFALGSIVYEMLSGISPFDDEVMMRILYRIVQEPLVPLAPRCPDVPESVCSVVEKALEKKPEDRYPSVAAFIEALTGSPLRTLAEATAEFEVASPAAPRTGPSVPAPVPGPTVVGRNPRSAASSAPASVAPDVAVEPSPQASVPQVAPPAGVPAKSRRPVVIAASLVALVGAVVSVGLLRREPPPVEPAPALVAPPTVTARPPAPTVTAPPPTVTPPPEAAKPTVEEPSAATPERKDPEPVAARPVARPVSRPETEEKIPEDVRADLAAAERALASEQAEEALRLARRSQRKLVTGASYSVLTRAHCQRKDLTNARAQWGNVPSSEKAKVRQFCKLWEIDF
ncbi:serine/threonine protein kinase [Melittangium boletus]|uniref:Serine/threonine protein kinase n=1 Tax=Melittangium boletus DSM 14713 TaxID=1294270 RepID=A0A250I9T0_9BACT|nr:serine/threonine-protein kinase [Melittangium boletus]ATB27912.1 serine/threonine protein kinase [Melittangium boletus DSM 14713]